MILCHRSLCVARLEILFAGKKQEFTLLHFHLDLASTDDKISRSSVRCDVYISILRFRFSIVFDSIPVIKRFRKGSFCADVPMVYPK